MEWFMFILSTQPANYHLSCRGNLQLASTTPEWDIHQHLHGFFPWREIPPAPQSLGPKSWEKCSSDSGIITRQTPMRHDHVPGLCPAPQVTKNSNANALMLRKHNQCLDITIGNNIHIEYSPLLPTEKKGINKILCCTSLHFFVKQYLLL